MCLFRGVCETATLTLSLPKRHFNRNHTMPASRALRIVETEQNLKKTLLATEEAGRDLNILSRFLGLSISYSSCLIFGRDNGGGGNCDSSGSPRSFHRNVSSFCVVQKDLRNIQAALFSSFSYVIRG